MSVYSEVRDLEPGDILTLPLKDWTAAKVAAHRFKNIFGVRYKVHKVKGKDEVTVTRIL